jgi:hypothetical protein
VVLEQDDEADGVGSRRVARLVAAMTVEMEAFAVWMIGG